MTITERAPTHAVTAADRLASIDVFRGATIVGMLLTIQGGAASAHYAQLRHAEWVGWTFADTVAPCFMWIVGVVLSISTEKRRRRGDGLGSMLSHLTRRAILIFVIGVLLGLIPAAIEIDLASLSVFKIMGTLQRIAIAYFLAGVVVILTREMRGYLTAAGVALLTSCLLLERLSVPGFALGTVTQDGNAINFLDRWLLGSHSAWTHPLLSAFTASATVLLGAVAGRVLLRETPARTKLCLLLCLGGSLALGGVILKHWIPVVMFIWTPSYCLLMGGIATLAYACVYWLLEMRHATRGSGPFVMFGRNPIAMWVLSGILETLLRAKGVTGHDGVWRSIWTWVYEKAFVPLGTPQHASFAFALMWVFLFYVIARLMYTKQWIIRI